MSEGHLLHVGHRRLTGEFASSHGKAIRLLRQVLQWTIFVSVFLPTAEAQRRCQPNDLTCEVVRLQNTVVSLEQKFIEQQRVVDNLESKLVELVSQLNSGSQVNSLSFQHPPVSLAQTTTPTENYNHIGVNGPDHGIIRPNPNSPYQPGSPDDPNTWPKDCFDIWQRGDRTSRVHSFYNRDLNQKFQTYCNMSGQPWMVIFRHGMGRGSAFNRSWNEYRSGFGDSRPGGSFWIGSELLHRLTYAHDYRLMVQVRHSPHLWHEGERNATKYAIYDYVRVEPEAYRYALVVQSYEGNMGNVLDCADTQMRHNLMGFSTYDVDNDQWEWGQCANSMGFGFWHNDCGSAKFGEREPDYLNCDTRRWHYELDEVVIALARKNPMFQNFG